MVVRIVHGQAGSLYSALLKEAGSNTQEQPKDVKAGAAKAESAVAKVTTSDAVKVSLSSQSGQGVSQAVQSSQLSEIVTTSRQGRVNSSERIESYKEAKQATVQLVEEMRDEPGKSMEAHNVNGASVQGSRMQ